jgi:hypothetical protein
MSNSLIKTHPNGNVDVHTSHTKDYSNLEMNPNGNKEITVSGPLAEVFTQALNQLYAKDNSVLYANGDNHQLADKAQSEGELQGEPNSERDKVSPMVVTADGNLTGLESLLPKSIPEVVKNRKGRQYVYVTDGNEDINVDKLRGVIEDYGSGFHLVYEGYSDNKDLYTLRQMVIKHEGTIWRTASI